MRWFWFLCLTAGAISDARDRTVSCRLLAVCGAAGMIRAMTGEFPEHIPGMAVGAAMLLLGRMTGGAVGEGDGWFILASAGYLTIEEIWILVGGGLAVSWILSMGLILYKARRGENWRKATLPLLTCMWPAGVWLVL